MGFIISINTNGTMIDRETVEWLKENPPFRVNVTMYGASPAVYKKLCGRADGYDRFRHGVELLREAVEQSLAYTDQLRRQLWEQLDREAEEAARRG